MFVRPSLLLVGALLLAGCMQDKPVSIELRRDGETLMRCDSATVDELTPKPGGWAFKCDKTSVYVIYETDEGPAKGTVETVDFKDAEGETTQFVAEHALTVRPAEACAAVSEHEVGPAALPSKRGRIKPGTYTLGMAQPCAKLELVVGEAR